MFLRLYFLLPDEMSTQKVVDDLTQTGVNLRNLHAHVKHVGSSHLPEVTRWQKMDLAQSLENVIWRADLVIFFIALMAFLVALIMGSLYWSLAAFAMMLVTFVLGDRFAEIIPRVHLREFEHALSHGEVVLMVDVPKMNVDDVEERVRQYHPAAIPAGSSWTIHSLGI
ncbi:MAG: hypothetical protein OQL09_02205 [Gammaproteobacteria bacterium]|nr:hypothetical protein [Gammaproteobacteria bacterium]